MRMSTTAPPAASRSPAATAAATPGTWRSRLSMATVAGGALGAGMCITAWVIVGLRHLGIRVGRRATFEAFPLRWALGTMVFFVAFFALLAIVWPLGRRKPVAMTLGALCLFVALGLGFTSAGLLPLVPVTEDDRTYWIVLAVAGVILGGPVGLLMSLDASPPSGAARGAGPRPPEA
jgi:hypothetical protein